MPLSAIDNIGWYIQQLSGSAAQSVNSAPAINAPADVSTSAVGAGNTSALGQNLQLFMQALYEAISSADSIPAQNPGARDSQGSDFSTPTYPTYSKGQTTSLSAPGYQQGQSVLHGRIGALISALSPENAASRNVSSTGTSDGNFVDLQATFNRLLQEFAATNQRAPPAATSTTKSFSVVSGEGSTLTLNSWLQGLQQGLQRSTTAFSTVGNIIDVVV